MHHNITIRHTKPTDIYFINLRPEQIITHKVIQEYGPEEFINFYLKEADKDENGKPRFFTAVDDENGICYGACGILRVNNNVCEAVGLFTEQFVKLDYKNKYKIIKRIKSEIDKTDAERISANIIEDFTEARRFLDFLGFSFEAELERVGPYGMDVKTYKIIKG